MPLKEYYLRIQKFTQNRYSGDPEVEVSPDSIDAERILHVYLVGFISPDRSVELRFKRLMVSDTKFSLFSGDEAEDRLSYKASLPHYTLTTGTTYLLRAIDSVQDPWVITSQEIKTL